MITKEEVSVIGRINKTHGIGGELSLTLYDAALDAGIEVDDLECLVFDMDGIFVPFYLRAVRRRGAEGYLVTPDGVTSAEEATAFVGKDVYALLRDLPEEVVAGDDGLTLDDLVGYSIVDTDGTRVGIVDGIDDSTENVLFEVFDASGNMLHVPAAEPLITDVDTENKILTMNLPTGLY